MTPVYRLALCALACAFSVAAATLPARAALDTAIGPRITVASAPMSDCNTRAQGALQSVLQSAFEAGAGSGEWVAAERITPTSDASGSAIIECHAVGSGYAASFTCAAQVPPNPYTADELCSKLSTAFGVPAAAAPAASATPAATATPGGS
jgi:hypothetical protein